MAPEQRPDVVVIGASAGGVRALETLASGFPEGLDAAIFVVLHIAPQAESLMPHLLGRAGPLPAVHPADGALLETGRIHVAPPDRHLLLQNSAVRVIRGPKENRHRPSIDVLFRSAATAYGPRVVGVLLTGADDDGTAGMQAIHHHGGIAIIQDPLDSEFPRMPMGVLEVMEPDFILPLAEIGPVVAGLVQGDIAPRKRTSMPDKQPQEHGHPALPENPEALGAPSAFTCPDCSGTLWELRDGDLLRYVCRVGHGYSTASIIEAEDDTVERALWAAVRTLEESAALSRRIGQNTQVLRKDMLKKASEREHYAAVIRELLLKQSS